jgi:hypothetical protein
VIKTSLLAAGAVAIVVGASLIHPFGPPSGPRSNQTVLRDAKIDPETLAIVQRACQNCHSEQTRWPWYSHVAPVSWLIARDVKEARAHMNLSRWPDYSAAERMLLLSAIGSAVRNHAMPVQRYLLLHPEARLTDNERQQLYRWTRTERTRLRTLQPPAVPASPNWPPMVGSADRPESAASGKFLSKAKRVLLIQTLTLGQVLHVRYNSDTSKFLTREPPQEYTLSNSSLSLPFRGSANQKVKEPSYEATG